MANRAPWSWRAASASKFARVNVARLDPTVANVTAARSSSIPGSRSPARSSGMSLRPARPAAHSPGIHAVEERRSARARHPSTSSTKGRTCLPGRVARVAVCRSLRTSRAVGSRPWSRTNWSTNAFLASSMDVDRLENSSRNVAGTPATSYFGTVEWRRATGSHPHPSAWVR